MDPKACLVLLGLVVGPGSVTTLDFYLLKFLRGDATANGIEDGEQGALDRLHVGQGPS